MMLNRAVAVAFAALLVSCSKSDTIPTGEVASVQIVSGNGQTGFAGEELPEAVVVRVTDSAGAPISGQIVNFRVTEGGGSVFAGSAISDVSGLARERWTLGEVSGFQPVAQKLEARAVDSRTGAAIVLATFEATAIARPPTGLAYSENPATYFVGAPINPNGPSNSGGTALAYSISPDLPPGLTMYFNGVIAGTPTAVAPTATYVVTATNSGGSGTVHLTITVNPPRAPVITVQPLSSSVSGGAIATFSVEASGWELSYQWRRDGTPIAGATRDGYSFTPQSRADSGSVFTVVVSDAFGASTTSAPAVLTVLPGFWSTGGMTSSRSSHTATLLQSGEVLVAGGYSQAYINVSAELYDPTKGTFAGTVMMTTERVGHTATLLPSGKVLVAGGGAMPYGDPKSAELFDPATGTFAASGSMAAGRSGHTATLLPSGKVLVVGGCVDNPCTPSAELYDPALETFTATGSMVTARSGHTATLLPSGNVLVAGGCMSGTCTTSAELFDADAGTFTATGSMAAARSGHTATLLPSGKVLFVGGAGTSAEEYDPVSGTFSATGSMATARSAHTATLLTTGKVLVAGGTYTGVGPSGIASSELYDPGQGTFTSTGSMQWAASKQTATLLPNGNVLVAGGYTKWSSTSGAQLYEP